MGTGYLSDTELAWAMSRVDGITGDFGEVGVFKGALFNRLAMWAERRNITAHAFDSFSGLADPGPKDDAEQYPAGVFNVGGVEKFRERLSFPDTCKLWPGFIPQCFNGADHLRFAFVWVDVDHYEPTRRAIEWAWPQINRGGVLGFDDYFPGRDVLASPAIDEFLSQTPDALIARYNGNNQLFVGKSATFTP